MHANQKSGLALGLLLAAAALGAGCGGEDLGSPAALAGKGDILSADRVSRDQYFVYRGAQEAQLETESTRTYQLVGETARYDNVIDLVLSERLHYSVELVVLPPVDPPVDTADGTPSYPLLAAVSFHDMKGRRFCPGELCQFPLSDGSQQRRPKPSGLLSGEHVDFSDPSPDGVIRLEVGNTPGLRIVLEKPDRLERYPSGFEVELVTRWRWR